MEKDRLVIFLSFIFLHTYLTPSKPASASPPASAELRDRLKAQWDSLDTVAFRCEVYDLDAAGRPKYAQGATRYEIAIGSGGRRVLTETAVHPGGERRRISDSRDDGKRHYSLSYLPGYPAVIDRLTVTTQRYGVNEYVGPKVGPIWSFMPDGKPLYAHLDDGGTIEEASGAAGERTIALVYQGKYGPVRCDLDPEHDWLARRVETPGLPMVVVATRFARDNGRWLPQEGTETIFRGERQHRTAFEVAEVRVNRVTDAVFQPPAIPAGALVHDRTKGLKGEFHYQGGPAARRRFEAKYIAQSNQFAEGLSREKAATPPLVAGRDSSQFPWSLSIAAVSLASLGAAVYLRRRNPQ